VSDQAVPVPDHDVRGVLRVAPFRRLWLSLTLSSLGDWLGLLATTAMAAQLTTSSAADQNYAVAGVFILRLIPAVIFGPIAGVVADRLDRRLTMIVTDVLRFGLFASIPIVGTLWWLLVATFLIEILSLFWIPAKDASVPNLVPKERLEAANQISLISAYGSAPIAAGLFTLLSLVSGVLGAEYGYFVQNPAALALWLNALTFLVSAATIWSLVIPQTRVPREHQASFLRTMTEGWRFVGSTPLVRGLVLGMLGAFAAGGTVIGLAPTFVRGLGAGNPGYGVLFGAVFVGLAGGMTIGPRLLSGLSRRRLFALALVGAGVVLTAIALIPHLPVVVMLTLLLGVCSGVAWVTGYTLIGLEVADEVRGRTFAFVQSMVRITLVAVLAAAPLLSGAIGGHSLHPTENVTLTYSGAAFVFFGSGLLAVTVGVVSYRHMDDRPGVPLLRELLAAARSESLDPTPPGTGFFIAFEGGDGAGKSTQVALLAQWLRDKGHTVVVTREPGATRVGRQLREMLLDVESRLSPRTEALLYAADRAEHVESLIRPALEEGAVVITDRYSDSSVAYQGAGRELSHSEVEKLSRWATRGLRPALTIVLDIAPEVGLKRSAEPADRMESEPGEFHERVRQGFLDLAARDAKNYLVVDANRPSAELAAEIAARVGAVVPLSPKEAAALEEAEVQARREREAEEARVAAEAKERDAAQAARVAAEAKERDAAEAKERAAAAERARAGADQPTRPLELRSPEDAASSARDARSYEELFAEWCEADIDPAVLDEPRPNGNGAKGDGGKRAPEDATTFRLEDELLGPWEEDK
jgi:dTMP kinase